MGLLDCVRRQFGRSRSYARHMSLTITAGDDWQPEFWGITEAAAVVEGDVVLDELGEKCEVIEVIDLGDPMEQVVLMVRTPSGIVVELRLRRNELIELSSTADEAEE